MLLKHIRVLSALLSQIAQQSNGHIALYSLLQSHCMPNMVIHKTEEVCVKGCCHAKADPVRAFANTSAGHHAGCSHKEV